MKHRAMKQRGNEVEDDRVGLDAVELDMAEPDGPLVRQRVGVFGDFADRAAAAAAYDQTDTRED